MNIKWEGIRRMPSHFIFIQKSQNSRLGSREKDPIRFCGGVYVAKNTLRGPRPNGTGLGRPDG